MHIVQARYTHKLNKQISQKFMKTLFLHNQVLE